MPNSRPNTLERHTRQALRRVLFVSQRQAEAMTPPKAAALISITDVGKPPAAIGPGWAAVLRVAFDDVDAVTFPRQDSHLQALTAEQSAAIAVFAALQAQTCRCLVVHCRHGISRSAAVAKAVADAADLPFPTDYQEYNRSVYATLREVAAEAFAEAFRH